MMAAAQEPQVCFMTGHTWEFPLRPI